MISTGMNTMDQKKVKLEELPEELFIFEILNYLEPTFIIKTIYFVNRKFHEYSKSCILWKAFCEREVNQNKSIKLVLEKVWKSKSIEDFIKVFCGKNDFNTLIELWFIISSNRNIGFKKHSKVRGTKLLLYSNKDTVVRALDEHHEEYKGLACDPWHGEIYGLAVPLNQGILNTKIEKDEEYDYISFRVPRNDDDMCIEFWMMEKLSSVFVVSEEGLLGCGVTIDSEDSFISITSGNSNCTFVGGKKSLRNYKKVNLKEDIITLVVKRKKGSEEFCYLSVWINDVHMCECNEKIPLVRDGSSETSFLFPTVCFTYADQAVEFLCWLMK